MENKTKLTMGIAVALTLILGSGATYFFGQDDDAYYCEAREIVMICEKLSSGLGTRCYYEETYKICSEGWIKLKLEYQLEPADHSKQIICDQTECKPI